MLTPYFWISLLVIVLVFVAVYRKQTIMILLYMVNFGIGAAWSWLVYAQSSAIIEKIFDHATHMDTVKSERVLYFLLNAGAVFVAALMVWVWVGLASIMLFARLSLLVKWFVPDIENPYEGFLK